MSQFVLPYPVVPGKDPKEIAEYLYAHPTEYREARAAAGVTLERAYLQKTPMGNFVVAYLESDRDFASTMTASADTSNELNRRFAEMVKEIHGVDVTQPPPGPPPETIGEWRDEQVTTVKRGLAFCAPVLPGKTEDGKAFAREAYVSRRAELEASRRALGQNSEVVTLVHTPMGDIIAAYLQGDDPVESNRKFAASNAAFDRWFKDELKKLMPPEISFDEPVPPVEEIFDSQKLTVSA